MPRNFPISGRGLVPLDAARRALAEARTAFEVKEVGDKLEALRRYAQLANDPELEIAAMEYRVRAERRLGEILAETPLHRGGRPGRAKPLDQVEGFPTLAELGLTYDQAARAQRVAALDAAEFERRVADWRKQEARRRGRAVASLLKQVARPAAPAKTRPLPEGTYRCILADPPWPFEARSSAGEDRAPANHYPTMTVADIAALPVEDLAAPDCLLLLWAQWNDLQGALDVIDAWGFRPITGGFVWAKEGAPGLGYWTRQQTEPCLLASRGAPLRLDAGVGQLITAPRGRHSEKPAEQYARIERLVGGPYIELFARQARPGWAAWGDEACPRESGGPRGDPGSSPPTGSEDAG